MSAIIWKAPKGDWEVRTGGVVLHPTALTLPSRDYRVVVDTCCGEETCTVDLATKETMSAAELARRTQIVSSIQHVMRKECRKCYQHFFDQLTESEKRFIYTTAPALGGILGMHTTPEAGQAFTEPGSLRIVHK